ncbi:MAG: glycosyltransferase family 4 protein [Chitinophagaceae bacterium]|nr:MAG: glycosyltransferase family 4 protein [Chitinophagaceae bacterium]
MRIAILSPLAWRTPPEKYGPWEQVASSVTEGLVAEGHDVTLFASGNSITSGKLASVIAKPYGDDPAADVKVNESLHISHLMERASEFDIIHNHYDFLPLTYSRLIATPMITTIHGFSSPLIVPVYKKYNSVCHYVSISNADRNETLNYIATVYNGIDTAKFSFNAHPDDYLLFFGRIHPHKGASEAIEIASQSGRKLVIAGLIQDENYWKSKVEPFIDGDQVKYIGNCGPEQRNEVLGKASALLHPISFDEPFGLSVAEAMCCGTPVIAFNRGAMPELIIDNKTGFLVDKIDQAVQAVKRLGQLGRQDCRTHVEMFFSKEKMTKDYLRVYQQILNH